MVPVFLIRVRNLRIKSSETGNKYYIPPSCVQRYTAILPAIIHSGYFVSLNPSCNPFAVKYLLNGANSRNRTYNLSLTRRLLYQLSHISIKWCRWRDLNPQRFLSTDFKSVVYANSTTPANWSRKRDLNPRCRLGRAKCYHYTIPAL